MAPGTGYACDAEKTSVVMVLWDEKGFGGDEEVELLRELWRKGLFDRFEGLVLVGLGPRAIFFVSLSSR